MLVPIAAIATVGAVGGTPGTAEAGDCRPHWVTSWNVSPADASDREFADQTIRTGSYAHYGGSKVRLVLSNRYGDRPVTFDDVYAGVGPGGRMSASVKPKSSSRVLFDHKRRLTIEPGEDARSDAVRLRVRRGQSVVTSLYTSGPTGPATGHPEAVQTSYVAAGNHAGDPSSAAFTAIPDDRFGIPSPWIYFVDRVEVRATGNAATLVTLGDSITNGTASTKDADARYPDALARRLAKVRRADQLAIANAGIGANRILADSESAFSAGPSALHRLDDDVLSQPHLVGVLLLEGINDIGGSATFEGGSASAAEIIAGIREIARRVHEAGAEIFGGTLTPAGDPAEPFVLPPYSTAEAEQIREEVNEFIRTTNAFDGFVDFDEAVRDPVTPTRLLDAYDSGDHLHPNDAGYERMARAVRSSLLSELDSCPGRGQAGRMTGAR
jgi:lysophospholipase L1-like esterase